MDIGLRVRNKSPLSRRKDQMLASAQIGISLVPNLIKAFLEFQTTVVIKAMLALAIMVKGMPRSQETTRSMDLATTSPQLPI